MTGYIKKGNANKHILLIVWLLLLHQGWQVFYVRLVLGCFQSCASADRYFMSGLYLVALRAVHAALPSSFRVILTFRHRFLDSIKCKMKPDLRNFKV